MADENPDKPSQRSAAIVITKEELGKPPTPPTSPEAAGPRIQAAPVRPESLAPAPISSGVPAGFWIRFLAKVLDLAVALVVFVLVGTILSAVLWFGCLERPLPMWIELRPVLPRMAWWLVLGYIGFYAIYTVLAHSANGRSIGKAICGIRVLVPTQVSVGTLSMLVFFSARFMVSAMSLTLLGIGHALAGFRKDRRALNDLVVGTRVVRQPLAEG